MTPPIEAFEIFFYCPFTPYRSCPYSHAPSFCSGYAHQCLQPGLSSLVCGAGCG